MKSPNGNETFRLQKGKTIITFVVNHRKGRGAYQVSFKGQPFDRMDPVQMMVTGPIQGARNEYKKRLNQGFEPVKVLIQS